MKKISRNLRTRLQKIKLILFDVDGVLTDGSILIHPDGSESKSFDVRDGIAIRFASWAGLKIGFLSGRTSEAVSRRAEDLSLDVCVQGSTDKRRDFLGILEKLELQPEAAAYIGDDIVDIPVMRLAGFAGTVNDGSEEAKKIAHFVAEAKGGQGAAREIIELILKSQERWERVVRPYLEN